MTLDTDPSGQSRGEEQSRGELLPFLKKKFQSVLGEESGFGERIPLEEMAFFLKAKKNKNKNTKPHNCLASPGPLVRPSRAQRRPRASPGRPCARESLRVWAGVGMSINTYIWCILCV